MHLWGLVDFAHDTDVNEFSSSYTCDQSRLAVFHASDKQTEL